MAEQMKPKLDERISPATLADSKADAAGTTSASKKRGKRIAAAAAALALVICAGLGVHALMGAPSAPDQAGQEQAASQAAGSNESAGTAQDGASSSGASGKDAQAKTSGAPDANSGKETGTSAAKNAGTSSPQKKSSTSSKGGKTEKKPSGSTDAGTDASHIRVYIVIDSSAAESHGYPAQMASGTFKLEKDATVFDALIATDVSYRGSSTYVSAIGGLAEKQIGSGSGWMYSVNGEVPMKSCGKYHLSNGDKVRWYYVTGPLDKDKM